jgi:hypothetical protein
MIAFPVSFFHMHIPGYIWYYEAGYFYYEPKNFLVSQNIDLDRQPKTRCFFVVALSPS